MPDYFVGEPFCAVFRKISGIEKNGKREVEHQDYPSKFFWSLISENFCSGVLYCSIKLGCRKCRRKAEYQDFRRRFFGLFSAEFFRRGVLYCCINFGYQKSLDRRRGAEYQDFLSKIICLTVPKIFVGESFTVA